MNTKTKSVKGFFADSQVMKSSSITVRFTSDSEGETLSLDNGEVMIIVPYESVEPIIREARRVKKNEN